MMKKRVLILIISVSAVAILAVAGTIVYRSLYERADNEDYPSLKEEYTRLCQRMMTKDSSFSIAGTILLYDSESPNIVKEETPFSFTKNGSSFESIMGPMQALSNGNIFVQLDTTSYYLLVAPVNDSALQMAQQLLIPFDAMFSDTAQFRISGKVGGNREERFIELHSDYTPEIKSMTIYYNPSTYVISHAEIIWWKNDMLLNEGKKAETWITKISYSYPGYKVLDIESKIRNIVTINNNIAEPTTSYQDYRFSSSL